jgi:ubiquinone/menaquinone biosynthesis C-methylase UbiE
MRTSRRQGFWYVPGRLYDLAFGVILRGVRRRVAAAVRTEDLFPWLDVCCGTGSQFRALGAGDASGRVIGLDKSAGMVRYAAARAPGIPFVCGDAAQLPFKDGAFRAVSVSFGLHDKSPGVRSAIIREARRVLAPGGRLIAVDFENPWNAKSRVAAFFVWTIERLASGEHYRNGRDFLRRGGLRAFIRENGFEETTRRNIEAGSLSVVVARPVE